LKVRDASGVIVAAIELAGPGAYFAKGRDVRCWMDIYIYIYALYIYIYTYGMTMRDARVLHDEASRSGHFVLFPEGFSLRINSSCLDSSIRARCKSHLI